MASREWKIRNPDGGRRVLATKDLPGDRWLRLLSLADCRVEICTSTHALSVDEIKAAIGNRCDAVIGQLTETWGDTLFAALKVAGGRAYSNYAVGYNNVDVAAATRHGIAVGNTPGVLTDTTAEMALALTFAAARRTGESERFLRGGNYRGWLPSLFLGKLLHGRTVGIVGAGRIGAAYGRMMVEGHKMHLKYLDPVPNSELEACIRDYAGFLNARGEAPVSCSRSDTLEDILKTSDCVSLHTVLDESTFHMINAERLSLMKPDAVLVNTSRGPVIDEAALVAHCRMHPDFRAGLDVFEDEPALKPGLNELENVVLVPHIGSATSWTREGMAVLAAANVAGILMGFPVWRQPDIAPFLKENPPLAAPSIVNAMALNLAD